MGMPDVVDSIVADMNTGSSVPPEDVPPEGVPPKTEGEETPPKKDGEETPPKKEGEETPPKEKSKDNSVIRLLRSKVRELDKQVRDLTRQMPAAKAPERDDFETDEDYINARVKFGIEQQVQQREVQEASAKAVARTTESVFATVRQEHPDFDDVRSNLLEADIRISDAHQEAFQQAVQGLPYGGELYYQLASDIEHTAEIAMLPPALFAAKLGEMHEKIRISKTTTKKTKAPPPIKPVGGGGSSSSVDFDKMSMEDYVKWREQQTRLE